MTQHPNIRILSLCGMPISKEFSWWSNPPSSCWCANPPFHLHLGLGRKEKSSLGKERCLMGWGHKECSRSQFCINQHWDETSLQGCIWIMLSSFELHLGQQNYAHCALHPRALPLDLLWIHSLRELHSWIQRILFSPLNPSYLFLSWINFPMRFIPASSSPITDDLNSSNNCLRIFCPFLPLLLSSRNSSVSQNYILQQILWDLQQMSWEFNTEEQRCQGRCNYSIWVRINGSSGLQRQKLCLYPQNLTDVYISILPTANFLISPPELHLHL